MNGQTNFTVKAESEEFKNTLFLAMELSRATWLVATFAARLGDKINVHAIPGGNTKRLLELIGRLQAKLRGKGVSRMRTVCCYEAGYDGFWLHRVLVNNGIENHVLDAASLPIDRRAKHIKTDNIDAKRLLRAIVGFGMVIRKVAAWFARQRPRKRMRGASIASGSDWCANVLAI
jgi:transposase